MTNLQQRVLAAVVALPLLFLSIWRPEPYFFSGIVLVAALLGLGEFFSLADKVGCRTIRTLGFPAAFAFLAVFYLKLEASPWTAGVLAVFVGLMMFWGVLTATSPEEFSKALISQAATLFGVVYVAFLGGFLIGLRQLEPPLASRYLTLFFMIVMAGDTCAYFAGRAFGRRKLAPKISPGKTVEGSIGGILGSIALAVAAHYWFFDKLPVAHAVALAVVMNIVAQFGDLFESLLKRGAGAKDAASVIPGHGGLLDRLDSLLFNAPVLYYYALLSGIRM